MFYYSGCSLTKAFEVEVFRFDVVNRKLAIGMLVLTTFFWGSTFFLVKETVALIPLDGFLVVRFFIAAVLLTPFVLKSFEMNRVLLMKGLILGTLLYASFWFQTVGLTLTTPANAAFITGVNVVLVPILGGFWPFRRGISSRDLFPAIISLAGLALLTLNFENLSINAGDAIIILTAIAVAYHVLVTDTAKSHDPIVLVTIQLYVVAIEAFVVAYFRKSIWLPWVAPQPQVVWITLVVTAVFATAFAFVSQTVAQKSGVRAGTIAIIFALEPLFALLIDVFRSIFPSIFGLIGMLMILFANYWAISLDLSHQQRSE